MTEVTVLPTGSVSPRVTLGRAVGIYLFDVAETIDLRAISTLIREPVAQSRLSPKSATPAYVQYERPPVSFDGGIVAAAGFDQWHVRFRIYDYGVISVAFTRALAGDWGRLVADGQALVENPNLEQRAEELCRRTVERVKTALVRPRQSFLSEDYLVFIVSELEPVMTADDLVRMRGDDIAQMLRGEPATLSRQERASVLQHAMSYLADDLVIPSWNAAFVLDTPSGADTTTEILEFANSQLLQFRYYDQLLDDELASIYARLQHPRWYEQWIGSRYARAARHVHALFVDVNELTDRTENVLKFVGDLYAARLYTIVTDRLGLQAWKANVNEKLRTLDDIYRFAVEQSSMARGELMELAIVLILVLELVLVFLGVMS
jgi:hypothetical protein